MKKILPIILAVVLTASIAITGTAAYLTDTDSKENEFTLGNVDIGLDEPGFEDGSLLLPGVSVEKDPQIKNTGKTDAWVWMTVAIPSALYDHVELNYAAPWVQDEEVDTTTEQGKTIVTLKYPTVLAPNGVTEPAFTQVTLKDYVDADEAGNLLDADGNEIGWNVNTNPEIVVSGYAIQNKPFKTVDKAYNAYHGKKDFVVDSHGTLNEALGSSGTITVEEEIPDGENYEVAENIETEIDLNGNTLNGHITNNGEMSISNGTFEFADQALVNNGDATLENVTLNITADTADYAIRTNGGNTTLKDVDINSKGAGLNIFDGANVVFDGGSVSVNTQYSNGGRYNFYVVGEGTVLTIKEGTFSFNKNYNQKRAYIYAGAGTTVYVQGGTFGPASTRSGYTAGILGEGNIIITGGTFGFDPSAWVADGYEAVKDGTTWTVQAK